MIKKKSKIKYNKRSEDMKTIYSKLYQKKCLTSFSFRIYIYIYIHTPPNPNPIPLRRLFPTKLASRRDKGLCFTCNEKYHRGHKCLSREFLLIRDEDDTPYEDNMT